MGVPCETLQRRGVSWAPSGHVQCRPSRQTVQTNPLDVARCSIIEELVPEHPVSHAWTGPTVEIHTRLVPIRQRPQRPIKQRYGLGCIPLATRPAAGFLLRRCRTSRTGRTGLAPPQPPPQLRDERRLRVRVGRRVRLEGLQDRLARGHVDRPPRAEQLRVVLADDDQLRPGGVQLGAREEARPGQARQHADERVPQEDPPDLPPEPLQARVPVDGDVRVEDLLRKPAERPPLRVVERLEPARREAAAEADQVRGGADDDVDEEVERVWAVSLATSLFLLLRNTDGPWRTTTGRPAASFGRTKGACPRRVFQSDSRRCGGTRRDLLMISQYRSILVSISSSTLFIKASLPLWRWTLGPYPSSLFTAFRVSVGRLVGCS